jgi:hypothetical protein
MMRLRPTGCVVVVAAAVLGIGGARADEPVRLVAHDKIRGLEFRLVAGSFGRILDVNTSDSAPEETELKFFVAGNDVTPSVLRRPPLIEIAYVFTGISASQQCSFKVQLDAALNSISAFNLAYADIENALCPEFGIRPLQLWQDDFVVPGDYSRLLVIDVAGEGRADAPTARTNVWAQLAVSPTLFDDKARLIGEVTGFVDAHIFGGWSVLPADVAPANAPLTVTFADSDGVFFTLNDGAATSPAFLDRLLRAISALASSNVWLTFLVLAIVAVAVVIVVARRLSHRPGGGSVVEVTEPLRAVAVGYGADREYSLGGGANRDVALVMVYPGGRMRLVRKSADDPILVNGTAVGHDAWITAADRVIIGPKQFQFK